MSTSQDGKSSKRKRPPAAVFIVVLFLGLLGVYRVTTSARFESYRTVDVIQLVASGACFGAALVGFVAVLTRKRTQD